METARKMIDSALDQLGEQLEQGKSDQLKQYLRAMGRFHRYSAANALLIWLQNPEAIRVAGFGAWKKLRRHVKRGQKGIRILAPITRRETIVLENEEELTDEIVASFRPVYVWDVAQTDGKALPEAVKVEGDPGEYIDRLQRYVCELGIEQRTSRRLGTTEGISSGGTIVLSETLDPANAFSTLVHELAHELLHHDESDKTDRTTRETEAEAVAFVVSEAIGLSSGTASSDYLLSHQADRKKLMSSLQRIRRTSAMIIDTVMEDDRASDRIGRVQRAEALAA